MPKSSGVQTKVNNKLETAVNGIDVLYQKRVSSWLISRLCYLGGIVLVSLGFIIDHGYTISQEDLIVDHVITTNTIKKENEDV